MSWELLLPALAGGLGVYFLITHAQKAPDTQSCYFGLIPIGILALGPLICAIAIYSLFFLNEPGDGLNDDAWLKPAFIIGFFVFSGFFLDSLKRKIKWSESGVTVSRLLRKDLEHDWKNISELKYNNWAQWWKISFKSGESVVFYDMMRGSRHLIEACQTHGIKVQH